MLIQYSDLLRAPIFSIQDGEKIAGVAQVIIDPDDLKIIAFRVYGAIGADGGNILDARSVREYSSEFGLMIDSADEFITDSDVVKIEKVLMLNFNLFGLKVETKKGSKLGRVVDYTVTDDNLSVQQIIVKRPTFKSFLDPELTIPRPEIVEITDFKVIVRDEEKTIKERAMKEDFVPNFVNPFRTTEPAHSPIKSDSDLSSDDSEDA